MNYGIPKTILDAWEIVHPTIALELFEEEFPNRLLLFRSAISHNRWIVWGRAAEIVGMITGLAVGSMHNIPTTTILDTHISDVVEVVSCTLGSPLFIIVDESPSISDELWDRSSVVERPT